MPVGTEIATHLEVTVGVNADPALARELFVRGLMRVETIGDAVPPVTPSPGARYVIGAGVGAWAGHDGEIATYNSLGELSFLVGVDDSSMVVNAANGRVYLRHGGAWVALDDAAIAAATAAAADAAVAQGAANVALFEIAYGVDSNMVRHLYVDPVDGLDSNDGESTVTPVQTAARLFELIPSIIDQPTLVHLASGTLDLGSLVIPYPRGSRLLCFYADEAWDPRGDLYTIVATGVAGAGTNANQVVAAAALTENEHRGYSIRFTTGSAATTQRRTIRNNTTTAWQPCRALSPAPAAGNTYQVFTNNCVIRVGSASAQLTLSNPSAGKREGYAFVGVDIDSTLSNSILTLGSSVHQFYGVRARSNIIATAALGSCQVYAADNFNPLALNEQFGLPQSTWGDWGFTSEAGYVAPNSLAGGIDGCFVFKSLGVFSGTVFIRSGFVAGIVALAGSTIQVTGPSTTLRTLIGDPADTGTKISNTINAYVNLSSNALVSNNSSSNPAIVCDGRGLIQIASSISGSNANASGISVRARRGGFVRVTGNPGFGKSGVADWQCESTVAIAVGVGSVLTAADTAIRDAAKPESLILRVS